MDDLSPSSRSLLRTGRRALAPNDADRARILAVVDNATLAGTASTRTASPKRVWLTVLVSVALLTTAVAILVAARGERHSFQYVMPAASKPQPTHVVQNPIETTPEPTRVAPSISLAPRPVARRTHVAIASPSSAATSTEQVVREDGVDSLQEELRLLSRARAAIHRRDFATALIAVNEHASRFADGVLVEEREAARVRIVCATESEQVSRDALQRFVARFPTSAMRASVVTACTP